MIITKVLETEVNLSDPDEIFEKDVRGMLLRKLNAKYQNVCFSSILITKVIDIIRIPDRSMVTNLLDGSATMSVQFRVEGIILTKGEVLNGCMVTNVANFGIIFTHEHAAGVMNQDLHKKAITVVKKDQIVPVIIDDAKYSIGKSQISVSCKPYTPQPFSEVMYNINGILSPEDTEKIDEILTLIANETELHKNLPAEPYKFFKNLVYPYKKPRQFHLSPIGSNFKPVSINLKSLLEIREGCITISDLDTNEFLVHSKKPLQSGANVQIIDSPLYPALSSILHDKLRYMVALRGFVQQYNTPDKTHSMMAYWKVCMDLKE